MTGHQASRALGVAIGTLAAFASGARIVQGEERVVFGLRLERLGFPEFDASPVIDTPVGETRDFDAELLIATSGLQELGVQGWSMSVWNAGVDIVSFTTVGTASGPLSAGGYSDDGFISEGIVDPANNGGRQGVVLAVVLSFTRALELPINRTLPVARARYRTRIEDEGTLAFIRYKDSLRGAGQPVVNIATIGGDSVNPILDDRRIRIGRSPVRAESECADGIDNDRNGWIDCEDPYCRGHGSCGAEDCADGIDNDADAQIDCMDQDCSSRLACLELCDDGADNDRDGAVDCADSDCTGVVPCRPPEDCDDGIDNDGDGATDCRDKECIGVGDCPGIEICGDNVDNDADGKTDCDDSDCRRSIICVGPENCSDGVDNNGDGNIDCQDLYCINQRDCLRSEACDDGVDNDDDGKIDCDDPSCARVPPCFSSRETCDDGIDNNEDGRVDCDDPMCVHFPACVRPPENCTDGIDNNGDGKADCDDPQCAERPPCPGPEVCDDGFDNDLDGKTDCIDPDCSGVLPCPPTEVCDDGVDNDKDLRADCDDIECRSEPECAGREVCDDGADNDQNALVDCDDPDCDAASFCNQGGGGGFEMVIVGEESRFQGSESVVEVDPDLSDLVPVTVYILPFADAGTEGAQGWSIAIGHDKALLGFDPNGGAPTTTDTDAEYHFAGGFRVIEAAKDPTKPGAGAGGGGGNEDEPDGFISALILSFTQPSTLDPRVAQSIVRARYKLKSGFGSPGGETTAVRFKDGLKGSGPPVDNFLTLRGRSVRPVNLINLDVRNADLTAPFVRGDSNGDRNVNLSDAVWCVNELVRHGPRSPCPRASDVNADGLYDLSDAMYLIQWMFLAGPSIPSPYPACGRAGGPKSLECPEGANQACS